MSAISKLAAALFSGTQETTLALANLNFDFSLIKIEAPVEFHGVKNALTPQRRHVAESGSTHITARRLGALFDAAIPETPTLFEAYGKRASEIAGSASISSHASTSRGIFSDFLGPDATSIWAAATSGHTAIAVHLLACLLARIWKPSEAISIWAEIVHERQAELHKTINRDNYHASPLLLASQVSLTRDQLAEWDNSARAWLRYADKSQDMAQTKLKLVLDDLKLMINSKPTLYESVMDAWTTSLRGMESLLKGVSLAVSNAGVLLALSSWHLYPNISVLGNAPIMQNDALFPRGVTVSLNLEANPSRDLNGIYWSLSLSQMRYYGAPINTVRSYATDSSRLSVDKFLQVVLGSATCKWGSEGQDLTSVARVLQLLGSKAPSHCPPWIQMLAEAGSIFLNGTDATHAMQQKLVMLGRNRGSSMLADTSNHPLPVFGLADFSTFVGALKSTEYQIKILRKYAARFFPDIDPFKIVIRYQVSLKKTQRRTEETKPASALQLEAITRSNGDAKAASTMPERSGKRFLDEDGSASPESKRQRIKIDLPGEPDFNGVDSRLSGVTMTHNGSEMFDSSTKLVSDGPVVFVSNNTSASEKPTLGSPIKPESSGVSTEYTTAIPYFHGGHQKPGFFRWTDEPGDWFISDPSGANATTVIEKTNVKGFHETPRTLVVDEDDFRDGALNKNHDADTTNIPQQVSEVPLSRPTTYKYFIGNEREAAILVESEVLSKYESIWKQPLWARLPKISRRIDIADIKEALGNDALDLSDWLTDLFKPSRYAQSLLALNSAWELYKGLNEATISPEIVGNTITDFAWARETIPKESWSRTRSNTPQSRLTRQQAFSCIANLDTGGIDLAPSRFSNVMAMSSGDSIFVSSYLTRDPADHQPSNAVVRLSGNVGKPGMALLVPPADPLVLKPKHENWRFIDREEYTGQRDDHFGSTSLHLSFTDWSIPIDLGDTGLGRRDTEAHTVESLVSVFDCGRWIADLDVISALNKGNSQPDHEFFFRARCTHKGGQEVQSSSSEAGIVAIKNWDEFLERPDCPAVVLAHGNWEAKLAFASIGVKRGDRVFVIDKACDLCLEDLHSVGGSRLANKALFIV